MTTHLRGGSRSTTQDSKLRKESHSGQRNQKSALEVPFIDLELVSSFILPFSKPE